MTVVFVKIKSPHDSTQSVYFENVFANGRMGESRDVFRLLVGKPEGKKQLGRPRRRLEEITFRHHASYIQDRCTATPQSTFFIYLDNKYI